MLADQERLDRTLTRIEAERLPAWDCWCWPDREPVAVIQHHAFRLDQVITGANEKAAVSALEPGMLFDESDVFVTRELRARSSTFSLASRRARSMTA